MSGFVRFSGCRHRRCRRHHSYGVGIVMIVLARRGVERGDTDGGHRDNARFVSCVV